MKKLLTIALSGLLCSTALAQADRSLLREGNRSYNNKKYDEAEVTYRRALEHDSTDFRGQYNLASALYREKKYGEAARHFAQAMENPTIDKHKRARTLHNMGNSLLQAGLADEQQAMQYFGQAVTAYHESMKLEPKNEDTRYNLAYARRLLQQAQQQQQQQQQQQGGGNDQQQNKDQNQNQQQQQGDNQQQQDQQQQQNQNQQGNQQQQQQQQGQEQKQQHKQAKPTDQKRQDAERLLEAVKNNERQTLKEQNRKEQAATVRHTDKDW